MIGLGLVATISNAAKSLFSGANKEARQEKRALKKEAKAAAKDAKETAKKLITGGATGGAAVGDFFAKSWTWMKTNWQIIAIVLGALVALFMLFKFSKGKKRGSPRRRSSGASRGSSTMKARMAKVRAARKRKAPRRK
jgi:hypothetical protein